ncbi:MAG: SAM hydroxide adenosyltransferase, partial [Candidatus Glassbacteria bacterium]
AQAKKGKLLALIGSTGRLEVAANLDSALETLGGSALDAEVTITKV